MLSYSQLEFPILDMGALPAEIKPNKKDLKSLQQAMSFDRKNSTQRYADNVDSHCWERPSLLLIAQVYKLHKAMKKVIP